MNDILRYRLGMIRFILPVLFVVSALPGFAQPTVYDLQKDDSTVGFTWFFGEDAIQGSMPVGRAEILLDVRELENSKVTVTADVTGAKAGFVFATQGIKSKKVLWADEHPEIIFESTAFRRVEDGAVVDGNITVRGVTMPTTLNAKLFRQAGTDDGDLSRLSVHLTGALSRSAFGADGWSNFAGDEVQISIIARMQIATTG